MKNRRELSQLLRLVERVYWDDFWSLGEMTRRFEEQAGLILFNNLRNVLLVGNGTIAIELVLQYLKKVVIGNDRKKPKVLMPVMTVPMVKWAIQRAGFEPVFVDCGYDHNMDRNFFVQAVQNTKPFAVVWVYTGGLMPAGMNEIAKICKENAVWLIEDMSHAQLSKSSDGVLAGTVGDFAVGSMYATKVLSAGEGGFVGFPQNDEVEEKLRILRNQGKREGSGVFEYDSYNYRISEFSAAVALIRLINLHKEIAQRSVIASYYNARLADLIPDIDIKHRVLNCKPSWYKYIIQLNEEWMPDVVAGACNRFAFRFPGKVHSELLDHEKSYPLAESVVRSHLCLPLDSEERAERTIKFFIPVIRNRNNFNNLLDKG